MTSLSSDVAHAQAAALALRKFRMVFNAVRTHFRQMEKVSGLGGAQVWALSLIAHKPGTGVGELARQMDIHQSTASNLIKVLLKKELISLHKAGPDKRAVQLHLLPAGEQVLAKIPGPFEGVLPQALGQLDAATLARLNQDLQVLVQILRVDEAAGVTPLASM